MELTYRLTREDHKRFLMAARSRIRKHYPWPFGSEIMTTLIFTVTPFALLILVLVYLRKQGLLDRAGYDAGIFSYVFARASYLLYRFIYSHLFDRNSLSSDGSFWDENHLKLDDTGIEASNSSGDTLTAWRWAAFREISREGELWILWRDQNAGIIVPLRAFADDAGRQRFNDLVKGHIGSAK